MTVSGGKKREQSASDNEEESSLPGRSGTEEFLRLLPASKPPEKLDTDEEIIEIQECPSQDLVHRFSADGYLCDRLSADEEPVQKLTQSSTEVLGKLPRNEPAVTDTLLRKPSENAPRPQLLNVDADVMFDAKVGKPVSSEDVWDLNGPDSSRNAAYKVQDIRKKMNDRACPVETDGEGQTSDQIISEKYGDEEAADIFTLTVPVKISLEPQTGVIETNAAGVENGSSSDSSTSADTVRAVCSTPQPRTLSSCSLYSGAESTDAADSLPEDSVELRLSDAGAPAVCGEVSTLSCSTSVVGSEDSYSLSQADTPDTPSISSTTFSCDSSNRAENSYINYATEDSSVTEESRVPNRKSSQSLTDAEDHKEQGGPQGAEAEKGSKLVSRRTVYWTPGTPPPPRQDGSEPVLLHFVTIDPDPVIPVKKMDQASLKLGQSRAKPLGKAKQITDSDGLGMVDGSQREKQAKESDHKEPVISVVDGIPEVGSNLQEPEVASGPEESEVTSGHEELEFTPCTDEPDVTSGRREPASVVVSNWLMSSPPSLDGYVARIVRRHSTCEGDTMPPPPSGRKLSPTNFSLEEAKKMLERGSRAEVKPQVSPWTEIGTEGRVVRLREMYEQLIQSERRAGARAASLHTCRSMASLPGSGSADRPDPVQLTSVQRSHSTAALWRPVEIHSLEQQAMERQKDQRHPSQRQVGDATADTAADTDADTADDTTDSRRQADAPSPGRRGTSHRSLSCSAAEPHSAASPDADRAHFEAILRYFEGLRDGRILDGASRPTRGRTPSHRTALSWLRRRWPSADTLRQFDLGRVGLRRSLGAMPPPLSPPTGEDDGDGLDDAESVVLAPAPPESPAPPPRVMAEYPYLSRRRSRPRLVARGLISHQELVHRAQDRVVVFGPGLFQGSVGADNTFQLYVPDPQCSPQRVSVQAASPTAGARCQLRYLGYMYHEVRYRVTEAGWYRVTVTLGAHAADVDVLVRVT